jgi:hypothetical protein
MEMPENVTRRVGATLPLMEAGTNTEKVTHNRKTWSKRKGAGEKEAREPVAFEKA